MEVGDEVEEVEGPPKKLAMDSCLEDMANKEQGTRNARTNNLAGRDHSCKESKDLIWNAWARVTLV